MLLKLTVILMLELFLSSGLDLIITWLVVTVIASFLAAIIYPLFKKLVRLNGSQTQPSTLFVYGILPPLAAVLVVVMLAHPDLSSRLVPEHCHPDTCAPHLPEIVFSSEVGLTLVTLSLLTLLAIILLVKFSLSKSNRLLQMLNRLSENSPDINYRVIDSPEMLAWCAGIWQPNIYLSRGLVEALTRQQLQVVVVHELIHIARRDNLKKFMLRYTTLFWLPKLRASFLSDFSEHTEQACEYITATKFNDPALVAKVMQRVCEKADNHGSKTAGFFEEKKLAINHMSLSSNHEVARINLWSWLFVVTFWMLQIILLTGITHLGFEWATG
ncbi:M56 family metallopeptidase [Oceanicoccus sp. KOV_DT_Chl]|uniref:M56 family metallopeptidase n=1 Tax=Oceanicoccus sp. KOV_DT_Chl TaxID=1904639 RepID=UPI000C7B17DD|nr:M56 family metallopeptidase [Oceanicoccus sp. KOV_DT_Chl]